MCIDSFLREVAKEYLLSFSDLKGEYFNNFYDADKLDSASMEDFKSFLKQHDIIRVSHHSVILYLKSVEMLHFRKDVSFRLCRLKQDSVKHEKQIGSLHFSAVLLLGVLTVRGIIRIAFEK